MRKETFVLTLKAEDRPGLLHLITGAIEKRLVRITSLSSASTDVHDMILITIEVEGEESILAQLALKLENIVEVYSVEVSRYNQAVCLRAAYFKIAKSFLETPRVSVLQKHSAVIVNWYADAFLVAKYGSDAAIRNLYNELDGPHLLGFSQTGLIADSKLMDSEEVRVISPEINQEGQSSVISMAA